MVVGKVMPVVNELREHNGCARTVLESSGSLAAQVCSMPNCLSRDEEAAEQVLAYERHTGHMDTMHALGC